MIALTQEMREKRINWLKDRISSMEQCRDEIPFGLSEDESMELSAYKDSLASLTAEEVNQVIFNNHLEDGYVEWVDCNKDYFNSNPSDYRRVLYTSPPVPEIKFPGISELAEQQGCLPAVRDVAIWDFAISEVKRINGLGE